MLTEKGGSLVLAMPVRQPAIVEQLQRFSRWLVRSTHRQSRIDQRVLLISSDYHDAIGQLCWRLGWGLEHAAGLSPALLCLRDRSFEAIIYDRELPDPNWRSAITSLATRAPRSSILLLSPPDYPELWNEVIRLGGHDMLTKPVSGANVESAVALAIARARLTRGIP